MQTALAPRRLQRGLLAVMAVLSVVSTAHAQTASPLELERLLRTGDDVTVTDRTGAVTRGNLVHLSDRVLEIDVKSGARVEVPSTTAVRIDRTRRRTSRGALVGLVVGAAGGAIWAAIQPPCHGLCFGPSRSGLILPAAGFFGGIGAGVGAIVGSAWPGHETIHVSQAPSWVP